MDFWGFFPLDQSTWNVKLITPHVNLCNKKNSIITVMVLVMVINTVVKLIFQFEDVVAYVYSSIGMSGFKVVSGDKKNDFSWVIKSKYEVEHIM